MFMKIKGGKAFRRAAQAAPKSAEGARKARAPSDSGLPLVAGIAPGGRRGPPLRKIASPLRPWCLCALVVSVFLFSTADQRRPRMNSRYRLPSFVVFALSSIIRHLSSVLCAFVVKSFLPGLPVLPVNLAFFPPWRRAFVVSVGNLASKLPDSCVQSSAIITSMIAW
jgi:hypothetical protein